MKIILKANLDNVLNLAIEYMVGYIYCGEKKKELKEAYESLERYIDTNLIDEDIEIRWNRLKEILNILGVIEEDIEYLKKDSDWNSIDNLESIHILKKDIFLSEY